MKKRFTALLLCLLMILTLTPATAFAEENYTLTYTGPNTGYLAVYVSGNREASLYSGNSCSIPQNSMVKINYIGFSARTLFDGWTATGLDTFQFKDLPEETFRMPGENVTLTAEMRSLENPEAAIDENGILTWNAIDGYQSVARVVYKQMGGTKYPLLASDRIDAANGKYTFDLKAAVQQYEAENGSLGNVELVINTAYWKSSDPQDSASRGQWENALTYNYDGAQKLETPTNLRWDGFTARWDPVEHAAKYIIEILYNYGGISLQTFTVSEPAFNLHQISDRLKEGENYSFYVRALPEDSSTEYMGGDFSSRSADSEPYRLPDDPVDYNLVVGGVDVTSKNAADIFGDGKVSYNPNTKILTLNNAVLNSGIYRKSDEDDGDLTVNVAGENTINVTDTYGIALGANALSLQGSGTLEITEVGGMGQQGIWAKKVTIDGVTLSIHSGESGIYAEATYGAPVDEGDETVNIINGAELNIVSSQSAAISAKGKISIDGSTVTAKTTDTSSNALYAWDGGIEIKNSTVKVYAESSESPAIWAKTGIEVLSGSEVTATGGSSNTVYCDSSILVDDSTLELTDSSEKAYPALYASGDINIANESEVTAESKGMRGIFTDGDMNITDSTVTAVGTTKEGMVVVGTLNVTNSKLTAKAMDKEGYIPAIVTEHLNVTASDVTANGGMDLYDFNDSGSTAWDDITFKITPANGKLAEFKVDGTNWDGTEAVHFKEGAESPYDATVEFDADEMNWLGSYRYIHIGEHIHGGGTATCTDPAVCGDCGRTYGALGEHTLTEHAYKAPTCTGTGNRQYWECSTCHALFSDAQGSTTTTIEAVTIAQTGHDWGTPVWDWSDDGETASATFTCQNDNGHIQSLNADITSAVKTPATCTDAGTATCTAKVTFNGTEYSAHKDVEVSPLGHSMQKTDHKDATCTAPGKAAYFTCETCGKHFEDETGKTEITNLDEYGIIPATGHEAGTAWESDGKGHWNKCVNCGDKMNEAAHTYEWVTDKDATATEAGSKHEECTICGYAKAAVEIPAAAATEEPSDPSEPGKTPSEPPKDNPDTGVHSPQMGDSSNLILWFALLLASGASIAIVVYGRRKKREH